MDFKLKNFNLFKSDHKSFAAYLFSVAAMVVCVLYSLSYIAIGANLAAFVALTGAFVFMTNVGLMRRRVYTYTRYIPIIASLILTFIQSVISFGSSYGFQMLLLPLLIIIYIIFDYRILRERLVIYLFSVLLVFTYFVCELSTIPPQFSRALDFEKPFFVSSLVLSFMGILIILHYLSSEIFTTKEKLHSMATRDNLTALYNRRTFIKRGEEIFKIAERGGNTFSILLFDIDSFKEINDDNGHLVGDEFLKNLAVVSQNSLRDTDLIARYGGDEFAVLLHNTPSEHALFVAEKLRKLVYEHNVMVSPHKINRSISVGVVSYHYSIDTFASMMEMVDRAMYQSKYKGKNQTTVYNPADPFYRERV